MISEFYQGFWWCFPVLLVGLIVGYMFARSSSKSNEQSETTDCALAILTAWALLGILAFFSGYPVFEALKIWR